MLRMTMLTVSAAPVAARQANVSQNDARQAEADRGQRHRRDDRPEQHRTAPLDALDRTTPSPRSSATAPTAGAAYSQP